MKRALLTLVLAAAGCAQQGPYQITVAGSTVWRLDTRTGALEACGFEASRPACHPLPPPASQK